MEQTEKKRIDSIDALRGLAVVLMIIHHFLFDLVSFLGAPPALFDNPVFNFLHYVFAGLFILLSGVSSRFSRSNVRRGIKVLVIALAITGVTWLMGMPILFGVLHLLGVCMVLYGLTRKFWDRFRGPAMPVVCLILLVGSALAVKYLPVNVRFLWMFGWTYPGFYSADYFPIFPWLFVFLIGTWVGIFIREGKFPRRFYTFTVPFFPAVGRRALLLYIVHQPVLYGITTLIGLILKKI